MANLNIVIAMAGASSRFFEAGYKIPKYMVSVGGKSLFSHSLSSLPLAMAERVIFVALESHRLDYGLESFLEREVRSLSLEEKEIRLRLLARPTGGQAETVLEAREFVGEEEELLIYNIDTMFSSSTLGTNLGEVSRKEDGIFGVFGLNYPDSRWSFANFDGGGMLLETAEKRQISQWASTGLYHFTRAGDFFRVAEARIRGGGSEFREFYVAPLYNDLIAQGGRFRVDLAEEMVPLGTPGDVERFSFAHRISS
jgi:NDP-sugar pyrophosphorylase family protein